MSSKANPGTNRRWRGSLALLVLSDGMIMIVMVALLVLQVGFGSQTDAFFGGQAVTASLLGLFHLPIHRATVLAYGERASSDLPAGRLLACLLGLSSIAMALLWVGAGPIVRFLYPSFDGSTLDLAVAVLRICALGAVLGPVSIALLALNHVEGRFRQAESATAAASLAGLIVMLLTVERYGALAAAYAILAKSCASSVAYWVLLHGRISWAAPPWGRIISTVTPLVSIGTLTKLAPVIDRSIASAAGTGAMSLLVFAQAIYGATVGFAERAVVSPRLPAYRSKPDVAMAMNLGMKLFMVGLSIALLACAGFWLGWQSGLFEPWLPDDSARILAGCLIGLGLFPAAALLTQWLVALLNVTGHAGFTAMVAAAGFLLSIGAKLLGFHVGGVIGLAAAVSLYYSVVAAAYVVGLRRTMHIHA